MQGGTIAHMLSYPAKKRLARLLVTLHTKQKPVAGTLRGRIASGVRLYIRCNKFAASSSRFLPLPSFLLLDLASYMTVLASLSLFPSLPGGLTTRERGFHRQREGGNERNKGT